MGLQLRRVKREADKITDLAQHLFRLSYQLLIAHFHVMRQKLCLLTHFANTPDPEFGHAFDITCWGEPGVAVAKSDIAPIANDMTKMRIGKRPCDLMHLQSMKRCFVTGARGAETRRINLVECAQRLKWLGAVMLPKNVLQRFVFYPHIPPLMHLGEGFPQRCGVAGMTIQRVDGIG